MSESYPPFSEEKIGDQIGEGKENIVHSFDSDMVLKEPNIEAFTQRISETVTSGSEEEKAQLDQLIEYFKSVEHFKTSQKDYSNLKNIFGEMLADSMYVLGEPREGNETGHYIFQKKIEGETWQNYANRLSEDEIREFVDLHKDEFITLIGGARKVLVETGGLMDLWEGNVIVEQSQDKERIKIIDYGTPSEYKMVLNGELPLPKGTLKDFTSKIISMLGTLDRYTESLNLTPQEKDAMNKQFNMTEDDYVAAKNELLKKCADNLGE